MTKYKQFITIVVLCTAVFLNFTMQSLAEDLITVEKALEKVFSKTAHFDSEVIVLSGEQIKVIEEKAKIIFAGSHSAKVRMYTAKENNQVLGFALEDTVIGKWGPIHYLVGLDATGTIQQVVILDYQEIRGRPVAKKRFLRQYKKKNISNPLRLRKDIDGVTGATISSRSLTNGIRKLLFIFEEYRVQ